jgi:hypothetical protein
LDKNNPHIVPPGAFDKTGQLPALWGFALNLYRHLFQPIGIREITEGTSSFTETRSPPIFFTKYACGAILTETGSREASAKAIVTGISNPNHNQHLLFFNRIRRIINQTSCLILLLLILSNRAMPPNRSVIGI